MIIEPLFNHLQKNTFRFSTHNRTWYLLNIKETPTSLCVSCVVKVKWKPELARAFPSLQTEGKLGYLVNI